jgi:general secretion pathway protein G
LGWTLMDTCRLDYARSQAVGLKPRLWLRIVCWGLLGLTVLCGVIALVATNVHPEGDDAKMRLTRATVRSGLGGALDSYRHDLGHYPSESEGGLQALLTQPASASNWRGPYVSPDRLLDCWGKPFIYACPGSHNPQSYDLCSYGKDEEAGTDDITNWK